MKALTNKETLTDVKNVAKVLRTSNYSLFKTLSGNRNLDKLHLKKLTDSIKAKNLFSPIMVNDRYEIIDGQHRFEIKKSLGLPIEFIIVEGYGLEEVHILNSHQRNWGVQDYLNGYIELGYEDYFLFKKFIEDYNFGYLESIAMLSNKTTIQGNLYDAFKNGDFKINSSEEAVQDAEKINMVSRYYQGYKRRGFVTAMLTCFRNPEYNHAVFLSKLEVLSTKMVDCTDRKSYLTLIEEIYNYKNKKRVSLRFTKKSL